MTEEMVERQKCFLSGRGEPEPGSEGKNLMIAFLRHGAYDLV